MIVPFHLAPVTIERGALCRKINNAQYYIMFRRRWSTQDVENFENKGKLPPFCSLDKLNASRMVVPITIIHERGPGGWTVPGALQLKKPTVSILAQPFNQILIFNENIQALNTKLSVVPSEFVRLEDEAFRAKFKASTQRKILDFARYDNVLDENPMHFKQPFKDITGLVLALLDPSKGEDELVFKRGMPAIKKQSYVHSYGYLLQHQASRIISARAGEEEEDEEEADMEEGQDHSGNSESEATPEGFFLKSVMWLPCCLPRSRPLCKTMSQTS